MAIQNYYAILGVSRDEAATSIQAIYRDALRQIRPSYGGPQLSTNLRQLMEAHSVLSDPIRRHNYNESIDSYERDRNESKMVHDFEAGEMPRSLLADAHAVHPSVEALAERLLRNFTGRHVPKAERPQQLNVEVILTPEEAARGGVLALGVPAYQVCDTCGGSGRDWLLPCADCAGQGTVAITRPLQICLPPSSGFGARPEIALDPLGIENLYLTLSIRVSNE
jgi:DnaJ-class molecular chaperone